MEYFIFDNNEQQGPFTLSELEQKKIKRDTLIWFVGLSNWEKAENLTQFKHLFTNIRPPQPPTFSNLEQLEKENDSKIKPIYIILLIIILGGVLIYFNYFKGINDNYSYTTSNNQNQPPNPQMTPIPIDKGVLESQLNQIEAESPNEYLIITTSKSKINLVNQYVIEGEIFNKAKM